MLALNQLLTNGCLDRSPDHVSPHHAVSHSLVLSFLMTLTIWAVIVDTCMDLGLLLPLTICVEMPVCLLSDTHSGICVFSEPIKKIFFTIFCNNSNFHFINYFVHGHFVFSIFNSNTSIYALLCFYFKINISMWMATACLICLLTGLPLAVLLSLSFCLTVLIISHHEEWLLEHLLQAPVLIST